jgi:hypothetical protein
MVMDPFPEAEWCTCDPKTTVNGKEYPPNNGKGKASSTGDYGRSGSGNVTKLTRQGGKPNTF